MKKLAAIVAAVALAICLAGCSGMSKEDYINDSAVVYLTAGEYGSDLSLLLYSLPLYESGDIDYEAYGRLKDKCEYIVNMTNYPKDFAEAHEDLVKGANGILSQVDLMVDCAANMELYHITNDGKYMDDAIEQLEALSVMQEQAGDYILDSLKAMEEAVQ